MRLNYAFAAALSLFSVAGLSASAQQTAVDYLNVTPADGAVLKSLSQIVFTLPTVDDTFETMLNPDESKLEDVAVLKDNQKVASFAEFGEATGDDEGNMIMTLILSETIAAEGEYTISIPEGLFVQMNWEDFTIVEDAKITAAYNATFTINPTLKSPVDNYLLTPANGTKVSEISEITIGFPEIPASTMFDGWEFPNATFTNGENSIEAIISYDWNSEEEYRVMKLTPINADEEENPITEAGNWTLTIEEGTFTLKGESNAEITAEFIVETVPTASTVDIVAVSPTDGETVKSISQVLFTLPVVDLTYETMLNIDMGKASEFAVLKGDVKVAGFGELGEGGEDLEGNMTIPVILSSAVTEDGEYTISIPEGMFAQMEWNDEAGDMVIMKDGKITAAYTANVTVNSSIKAPVESFNVTPEDGSKVSQISEVFIGFPEISASTMFDGWEFQNATFSDGETSIEAIINYDWNSEEEYRVMKVIPVNENEEETPITAAGTWILTIEKGTFVLDGDESPEITATFTIENSSTGIDEINAAYNENLKIFSIDGKTIPASGLNSLENGVYIINGKKMVVKK